MTAMPQPNDHAGILFMLDAAGRTIMELEARVERLTALVADVARERDEFRHLLDQARATTDVPPPGEQPAENGDHEQPPDPAAP